MTFEPIRIGRMTIGLVDKDQRLYRAIRHFPRDVARRLNAYGIDCDALLQAQSLGVETVEVEEHRGQNVRLFTMPIDQWINGPAGSLGDKGRRHYFVSLTDLPRPQVLRSEPCLRKMQCCGGKCREPSGHWTTQPLHTCDRCGDRR